MMIQELGDWMEKQEKNGLKVCRSCDLGLKVRRKKRDDPLIDWHYSRNGECSLVRCLLFLTGIVAGVYLMFRLWRWLLECRVKCREKRKWKEKLRRRLARCKKHG